MGLDMYLECDIRRGDTDPRAKRVFAVIDEQYPDGVLPDEYGEGISLSDYSYNGKTDPRMSAVRTAVQRNFPVVGTDNAWIGGNFTTDSITLPLIYWRKANAIHAWFVEKVQGGVDECQRSVVPREKLADLAKRLGEISADHSKASTLLETRSGFFFGGTEYDEWYFREIDETVAAFARIRKFGLTDDATIIYHSSW